MIRKPNAVIVDMDGTLVNVSSVRHHVRKGLQPDGTYNKYKNFRAFHEAAVNCPPILETVHMVMDWHMTGTKIIIVTARSSEFYHHSLWWLLLNEIPFDDMFMRPWGDYRADYEVKKDLLALIRDRYNPVFAFDDNPNIIRLWDEEGIPCRVIPGWEELDSEAA